MPGRAEEVAAKRLLELAGPGPPHETPLDVALTNSFGFGGTNGALLMRRFG